MKIKRFTAGSMQAGLKTISETLGPDAVILSNRRLANGLEIVAGVEEIDYERYLESKPAEQADAAQATDIIKADAALAGQPLDGDTMKHLFEAMADKNSQIFAPHQGASQQADTVSRQERVEPSFERSKPASRSNVVAHRAPQKVEFDADYQPNGAQPDYAEYEDYLEPEPEQGLVSSDISLLRQEIDGLKGMLKAQAEQLEDPAGPTQFSPQYERLESRLSALGFSSRLTKRLLSQFDKEEPIETNWRKTLFRLSSSISTPLYEPMANGGVFALTGPTGAGKSTTIAKLAALAVRDHGIDSVALISLDWHQVGGQEILSSVSEILGIEFHALSEKDSLSEALVKLSGKRLVLIDTSGSRVAVNHWNKLMKKPSLSNRIRKLLVLPSNMNQGSVNQFVDLHEQKDFAAVILSKLDESMSFGSVIEPVLKYGWPVWFCTTGQNIPKDIEKADSKALIGYLVEALKKDAAPLATAG
ncbi:flagellar biosynthesis protein FlhF [Reinekea thalattae]|uniref:Flagellar biosynthesis protein FlhF n=1 Tax=Reinekea thalattae TaxID=2593301 RepID=A0A5C8Z8M5_9GAMM|nr:flagellar biosynthesis protein FlhF [Reinekea thalattae]TXR53206.1 flagellar biosynthesis protein FlhF [Reinekea thalattae]